MDLDGTEAFGISLVDIDDAAVRGVTDAVAATRFVVAGRRAAAAGCVRRMGTIGGPLVQHKVDFAFASESHEDERALQGVEEDERIPQDGHFSQRRRETKHPAKAHD